MRLLTSLDKVFADEAPAERTGASPVSGFRNEVISFQAAYRIEEVGRDAVARLCVTSPLGSRVQVRMVELVPVGLATFADSDENYLRRTAGMFPDLLSKPKKHMQVRVFSRQWRCLWIDVTPGEDTPAGVYPIEIALHSLDGELLASREAKVEILDASLPPQALIHTKWFYTDCIAEYYGVPVWSEAHWSMIESFMRAATRRGMNMILTPTFTPALDTAVNTERLTTQLVDVFVQGDTYRFGFDRLARWIELSQACGFEYFEIAHLFTQWGAAHAPKVMATVGGVEQRIFGWETDSLSPEYGVFLKAYLTALTAWLRERGLAGKCYFHISDEPHIDHLEHYKTLKNLVAPYVEGFEIIDALSDIAFYKTGAIAKPIPANNHIQPFLDEKVPGLWTYYCVGQYKDVSNLFVAMPSARNRVFGVQLYKYDIEGILQWGYNFYNSQYSLERINPYAVTDAGGFTPSGDAFQVYPGPDGEPEESIRMMVTAEALYDLRALKLLESLTDKAYVMSIVEDGVQEPITFSKYPTSDEYLLNLRERVNREIMQRMK